MKAWKVGLRETSCQKNLLRRDIDAEHSTPNWTITETFSYCARSVPPVRTMYSVVKIPFGGGTVDFGLSTSALRWRTHAVPAHTAMPSPAGQGHNRKRKRRPLDFSLAIAVGAFSATLALAFTADLAPHDWHHDRCRHPSGGRPRAGGRFRSQQHHEQHRYSGRSRSVSLFSGDYGVPIGRGGSRIRSRSRSRRRIPKAASLGFCSTRAAAAAGFGGCFTETAGPAGRSRPTYRHCVTSRKEVLVVEEKREQKREQGEANRKVVAQQHQHRAGAAAAATTAAASAAGAIDTSTATRVEEGAPPKRRRKRPPQYWLDDENLRKEVVKFWADLGVNSDKIPNNTLLQFFWAYGLKHGIAMRGGVNECAEWLGVPAIPGKWSLALEEDEVVQLRRAGKLGDGSIQRGPLGGGSQLIRAATKNWPSRAAMEMGNRASASKHLLQKTEQGYWTKGNNFEREIISFNVHFQLEEALPAVWMVKLVDITKNGRRDIVNAIQRAGGYDPTVERLGLVHPHEWKNFADQLDTLRELRDFLTVDGVLQKRMPTLMAFEEAGRTRLRKKVVLLGGRKLVARKFNLHYKPGGDETSQEPDGLDFGRFDLGFAVDVLEYVYEQELQRSPVPRPLPKRTRGGGNTLVGSKKEGRSKFRFRPPAIMLPRRKHMLEGGAESARLVEQIEFYGGYENVARRLHLGYYYEDELQYQERVREELKAQNERYGKVRERNLEQQRNKLARLQMRLHMQRVNYERELKVAEGLRRRASERRE